MVEHLTFNQVVRGSNPRCFTLENAEDLKEKVFGFLFRGYIRKSKLLSYDKYT